MLAAIELLICFVLLSVFFYQLALKKDGKYKQLEKYPGPMNFPFIGNTWLFAKSETRLENILSLQRWYGNRVLLAGGNKKAIILFHPDDVGKILASREVNKSSLYNLIFTDWLGEGTLFYEKGKEYFRKRKMILPAFDVKRVDNFEENLNENVKTLVNILKVNEAKGQVTEIQELLRLCSLDMAFQYLVGKKTRSLENHDGGYATAVHNETKYVSHRAVSPWLWTKLLWEFSPTGRKEKLNRKILHDYMDNIIVESKAKTFAKTTMLDSKRSLKSDGEFEEKEKLKLLDLYIRKQEEGEPCLTNESIRNSTNGVLFAAHDTVTSALTFALYLLATHPLEQEKIVEELKDVFGDGTEGGNIEISEFGKLNYLECCIKESLRLYPPAPVMIRSVTQDFYLDEDLSIPTGVEIVVSPWATHRLAEFFPEPEKFMPSRFSPENAVGRHPNCYFPFSSGARSCMGQKIAMDKMKTILAHIFYNFTVELGPGAERIKPVGDMILTLKKGLHIKLTSRLTRNTK